VERELSDRLDLEVVVVDNNCSDHTAEVISDFEGRLPHLRHVVEVNQGLSHARNAGMQSASKEYAIYIDDDAVLTEGFLDRCEVVLRRFRPDLFGGPVLPLFDRPVPDWFDRNVEIRQFERFSGFSAKASISGGNFGIKRSVFDDLGPFDTALGMSGDTMAFGEDREMVERYRSKTPKHLQRLYYAVELPILHYTMPYKFDRSYQWQRKFGAAFAQERLFVKTGKRTLLRSLVYSAGHAVLSPIQVARIFFRYGWTSKARFLAVRYLYGVAGRALGVLVALAPNRRLGVRLGKGFGRSKQAVS
jgi:glycosyltransferase involved in cell wall biosynthesis